LHQVGISLYLMTQQNVLTEQIATAIMLPICIWEVPDLNLYRTSAVIFEVFWFYSGPQIKVGIHAAIKPKPLPLKSLEIHHSSVSSPEIRRYMPGVFY